MFNTKTWQNWSKKGTKRSKVHSIMRTSLPGSETVFICPKVSSSDTTPSEIPTTKNKFKNNLIARFTLIKQLLNFRTWRLSRPSSRRLGSSGSLFWRPLRIWTKTLVARVYRHQNWNSILIIGESRWLINSSKKSMNGSMVMETGLSLIRILMLQLDLKSIQEKLLTLGSKQKMIKQDPLEWRTASISNAGKKQLDLVIIVASILKCTWMKSRSSSKNYSLLTANKNTTSSEKSFVMVRTLTTIINRLK